MSRYRGLPASFLAAFASLGAFFCGAANAANINGACADDGGNFPQKCTKEIRIWNNTPRKIYVILQAGKQRHDAHNCSVTNDPKSGGDVWLQGALGDRTKCFQVTKDYHVYVNPDSGIPKGAFVSIKLPFWSKRKADAPDRYVDWWRGGRVVIFDDQTALNDTYLKLKGKPNRLVEFAAGSPLVRCNANPDDVCKPAELQVYQVPPSAQIAQHTPFQLNEFTFADVTPLDKGGDLITLNQNYNVSNVDQLYLPIAIEPVREPADVPYMGTTMSVGGLGGFRQRLKRFAGDPSVPNLLKWPVYNNPVRDGKRLYPTAGIRVPSPLAVFNYYMNPSRFPPPPNSKKEGEPEIIPANPPDLIDKMMEQWRICTKGTAPCPDKKVYQQLNDVFLANYGVYIKNGCDKKSNAPDWLKPLENSNPPRPKLTTFLRFVHGWVPFNTNCAGVPDLPTVANGFRDTIDYINLQYNYLKRPRARWFNPYARLIHGPESEGSLDANAYAFSIDDHASFQNNDGGSLPGGLIIAVGGANGLVNGTKMPPPIPEYHKLWDFSVSLGGASLNGAQWAKYGICSNTADTPFPPRKLGENGKPLGYVIGVDAVVQRTYPCNITLTDTKNRKYRIRVKQAGKPPQPIWPAFKAGGTSGKFDKDVISCPDLAGFVPPSDWCDHTNEVAVPKGFGGPQYELGIREPLQ